LIPEDHGFVRIDDHCRAEKPGQMADRVLCECGAPIAKTVTVEVLLGDLFNRADPLIPPVLDAVEPFFQFPPPLLLSELGDGLRCGFGGLLNPPSGEPELVPSELASPEDGHRAPLAKGYDDMTCTVPR